MFLGCYYEGQFLTNGYDKCSFLRCTYGDEPWYDSYGNIQLFTIKQDCAYGAAVSDYYRSGSDNPCTESSYDCPKRKISGVYLVKLICAKYLNK